jgi:uncharacterized protein
MCQSTGRLKFVPSRPLRPVAKAFFAVLLILIIRPQSFADIQVPELSSSVIDDADFFAPSDQEQLGRKIRRLFDAGGPQLQIWTMVELQGEPIESVTMRAADKWKLGRKDKDDGLILAIAKQERRFRLEVGRGLEATIPDALAGRMLRQFLVPALRRSAAASGANLVLNEITRLTLDKDAAAQVLGKSNARNGSKQTIDDVNADGEEDLASPAFNFIVLMLALALIFVLRAVMPAYGLSRHGYRRGNWSGGGGGWSGGGGGGGWSGGGGGFSGGGASGGW